MAIKDTKTNAKQWLLEKDSLYQFDWQVCYTVHWKNVMPFFEAQAKHAAKTLYDDGLIHLAKMIKVAQS